MSPKEPTLKPWAIHEAPSPARTSQRSLQRVQRAFGVRRVGIAAAVEGIRWRPSGRCTGCKVHSWVTEWELQAVQRAFGGVRVAISYGVMAALLAHRGLCKRCMGFGAEEIGVFTG